MIIKKKQLNAPVFSRSAPGSHVFSTKPLWRVEVWFTGFRSFQYEYVRSSKKLCEWLDSHFPDWWHICIYEKDGNVYRGRFYNPKHQNLKKP